MSQPQSQQHPQQPYQHPYLDSINSTAGSTHDTQSQPFNFDEIISDAITNAIWNGDMKFWKASEGWAGDRGNLHRMRYINGLTRTQAK